MSSIDRRTYFKRFSAGIAASKLIGYNLSGDNNPAASENENEYNIYFGDLHNHNAVGYGLGTVERAFDIAHSHLDFVSVTPHAYADYTPISGDDVPEYVSITRDRWMDVLELNKNHNVPGKFVTFPGYERHSREVGHYCIIFPDGAPPLTYYENLSDFQNFAHEMGAILIPHHPGYLEGTAGAVQKFWDPRVTMLLEIFSEHGNAERDTAPFDYIRHSMGGRYTPNTLQAILAAGHRMGVLASTDDHLGFPGAYGEGKVAILAKELTRAALFDALRKRRVYGVTGDRIELDFRLNGHIMGEELTYAYKRNISARVSGWHRIDRVELLKNNRVIHRDFPSDRPAAEFRNKPMLVRIEYGWGPMSTNQKPLSYDPPVYEWDMKINLEGGSILEVQPCFQSGPMEENRRHRITGKTGHSLHVGSYTSRRRAFAQQDTNAVVLKIMGGPETTLSVDMRKSAGKVIRKPLSELLLSDHLESIDRSTFKIHKLVHFDNAETSFTIIDEGNGENVDCYYMRVVQANGQLAWSSPIWVEKRQ